ncbi:hypothetical protein PMAYCL1PPCAC_19002, partial [Pristionchus mayeri]
MFITVIRITKEKRKCYPPGMEGMAGTGDSPEALLPLLGMGGIAGMGGTFASLFPLLNPKLPLLPLGPPAFMLNPCLFRPPPELNPPPLKLPVKPLWPSARWRIAMERRRRARRILIMETITPFYLPP